IIQFSQITVEELGQFIEEKVSKAIEKALSGKKRVKKSLSILVTKTARLFRCQFNNIISLE
ncbi:hypothetical protein NV63_18470, partial [Elizabethkingia anophelis]